MDQPEILLVCEAERIEEAIIRLGRIGYQQCKGYLLAGIEAWRESRETVEEITCISADEFFQHPSRLDGRMIDVRTRTEFDNGNISGSLSIPLSPLVNVQLLLNE